MSENKIKKCFIITPIGEDNSDIRRKADGVIEAVIKPVLIEHGFENDNIIAAHHISESGSINKQVIKRILEDDLVIANLTDLNPNVMYELAVRHAIRKPVIQICEKNTRLPFDIIEQRTIFYQNDILGVKELQHRLSKMVLEALEDKKPDNPIYRVIDTKIIDESPISNVEKHLYHKLDYIENIVSGLTRDVKQRYFEERFNYECQYSYAITINRCGISTEEIIDKAKVAFIEAKEKRFRIKDISILDQNLEEDTLTIYLELSANYMIHNLYEITSILKSIGIKVIDYEILAEKQYFPKS